MSKFSKKLKELFSFTRNERIAVAMLVIILAIVYFYPHFISKTNVDDKNFDEFKVLVDEFESNNKAETEISETPTKTYNNAKPKTEKSIETFEFDPNTADENIFIRLGFSQKQAAAIINYRNKGGQFKTADDFKKMYVVSDDYFARLKPYIKIKPAETKFLETTEKSSNTKENTTATRTIIFVEINSADTAELKNLRGIGSYYARLIADYRNKLGGFADINQLKEVRGIDDERFLMFANQVKIDTLLINKFNINKLTSKELAQHPYINAYTARGIEQYRNVAGKIESLQQLVKEKIINVEEVEKLRYYIEF
ncbi:MAG: helix-hairpin-helix domain-containing protein [Prevotellaceae bacterium]|jgi:competence ComEA-like helix-hairpin-helix protein|nr:helix-hairpin-helix domain-containing protein [Prevotellaceae bacterium]